MRLAWRATPPGGGDPMRYPIFALLAGLAVATPAGAQTWRSVTFNKEVENFIDASRVVRNGTRVRYWHRSRFTTILSAGDGQRYNELWTLLSTRSARGR